MKLFTPKSSSIEYAKKHTAEIEQVAYLNVTLDGLRKTIQREQAEWDIRLNEQRDAYAKEKSVLQQEVRDLTENVRSLSSQRTTLLIPITGIREEAEALLISATTKDYEASKKLEDLEDKFEELTRKIDVLSTRENAIIDKEQKLNLREQGIEAEALMISDSHGKLNDLVVEKNKELIEREHILSMRESELTLRSEAFQRSKASIETELAEERRALADKREAFEREFNRLKQ